MSRTLFFEQVVDVETVNNAKLDLQERINKLAELLNIDGVSFAHDDIRPLGFPEGFPQYRVRCYITKSTRKVTWDDIYGIVNSVKACYYKFI